MIGLEDVYMTDGGVSEITLLLLFKVLSERDEITNISHVEMPSYKDHCWFVRSRPYLEWWLIIGDGEPAGSVYVSRKHEIGIFLLDGHRHKGYGTAVLDRIKDRYKGCTLFANINPRNSPSISFFEGEGFKHIQNTYRLEN
jgi:GNAT superfamily N-acetyltransferase